MSLAGFILGKPYRRLDRVLKAAQGTLNGITGMLNSVTGTVTNVNTALGQLVARNLGTVDTPKFVGDVAADIVGDLGDLVAELDAANFGATINTAVGNAGTMFGNTGLMIEKVKDVVAELDTANFATQLTAMVTNTATLFDKFTASAEELQTILDQLASANVAATATPVIAPENVGTHMARLIANAGAGIINPWP